MKQFKFSVLFVSMICILIGYFEPANAAVINKSITKKFSTSSPAYAILNTTSTGCPFFPNPISPDQSIVAIHGGGEAVVFASVTYVGGGPSTVENNTQFEPVVENNTQFEPKVADGYFPDGTTLTAARLTFSSLPLGNYVLTIKTESGNLYTTKFTVAE